MWDFVGHRYWYFLFSLLLILPGLFFLATSGLELGIDFTGGTLWEIRFEAGPPQPAQVKELLAQHDHEEAVVQTTGEGTVVIRTREIKADSPEKQGLVRALEEAFGPFQEVRFDAVSPAVGAEVARQAGVAVVFASLAILLYLAWAFRQVGSFRRAFQFGTCAILAMIHDVAFTLGMAAILSRFAAGFEVDAMFLTALLTVIGFSVHDSIVVFDRIRENLRLFGESEFEKVVNFSIFQTLARSINTQLTVLLTLLALYLFGGITIRHFVLILMLGILSGTYSSIFNAAQLLVVWRNGWHRDFIAWLQSHWVQEATA